VRRREKDSDSPGPREAPIIVVWGPTGAPGRTTVAVGLASALVALGSQRTLLVDADLSRGTVAAHLGGEPGGATIASACALRPPAGGSITPRHLQRPRKDGPWLLAGLVRPRQGSAVDPSALGGLLGDLRVHCDIMVVDVGAALPPESRGDGHAACLGAADIVLAVCTASPVGLGDFLIQAPALVEALHEQTLNHVRVLLNHAEPAQTPRYRAEIERALGMPVIGHLPHDHAAVRQALAARRGLAQATPRTPIAASLLHVAERVGAAAVERRRATDPWASQDQSGPERAGRSPGAADDSRERRNEGWDARY